MTYGIEGGDGRARQAAERRINHRKPKRARPETTNKKNADAIITDNIGDFPSLWEQSN